MSVPENDSSNVSHLIWDKSEANTVYEEAKEQVSLALSFGLKKVVGSENLFKK